MHSAGPQKADLVQAESVQKLKARRLETLAPRELRGRRAPPRRVQLSLPQPVALVHSVAKRPLGLPDWSPLLARWAVSGTRGKSPYQKIPQPLVAGTSPEYSPAAVTGWKNSRPLQAGCSTGRSVQSLPP